MKPTFAQRFRSHFDNLMLRGTLAWIGMLFVLALIVVLTAGVVIAKTAEAMNAGKSYGGHTNLKNLKKYYSRQKTRLLLL